MESKGSAVGGPKLDNGRRKRAHRSPSTFFTTFVRPYVQIKRPRKFDQLVCTVQALIYSLSACLGLDRTGVQNVVACLYASPVRFRAGKQETLLIGLHTTTAALDGTEKCRLDVIDKAQRRNRQAPEAITGIQEWRSRNQDRDYLVLSTRTGSKLDNPS